MNSRKLIVCGSIVALVVAAWDHVTANASDASVLVSQASETTHRLTFGDHLRTIVVDGLSRTAIVHVPQNYNPEQQTSIVLAIHGAAMNATIMERFTGLNETSEKYGFVVVYPNGTGPELLMTFNAGGFSKGVGSQADDVKFLNLLLDDVTSVVNSDPKRIFACGMSNGGMMCYRLAAELPERIAAIAAVAGTMSIAEIQPQRPISVIHFHGTEDTLVPYEMIPGKSPFWLRLKSVDATIDTWRKFNGCERFSAVTDVLSNDHDELKVIRQTYGPAADGTEVVLVTIVGGGHSWPGQEQPYRFLGRSAMNVSANELIWNFFEKHPQN